MEDVPRIVDLETKLVSQQSNASTTATISMANSSTNLTNAHLGINMNNMNNNYNHVVSSPSNSVPFAFVSQNSFEISAPGTPVPQQQTNINQANASVSSYVE